MRTYNSMHSLAHKRSTKLSFCSIGTYVGRAEMQSHDRNEVSTLTGSP
jgi:hypothetical protein